MSRVARSAIGFLTSAAASTIGTVAAFFATPYVLDGLGAERLGAFRAASDWAGYLGLLEMGIAGAAAPLIAQAVATADKGQLRGVLRAGFWAYVRIAIWTFAAGLLLLAALPWLIRIPPDLSGELRIGFALLILATLFLPLGILRPLADATQRGYLVASLLGLQSLVIVIGCAAAAQLGWGLQGQFGVTGAGSLVLPLGLMLFYPGYLKRDRLSGSAKSDGAIVHRLNDLTRKTLGIHVVGRICQFTDNIVVGALVGPAAVAVLFLTTRLPQAIAGQVQAVGNVTWAGLAELYHSGRHDVFRARLVDLTRLTAALAAALIVPLAALTAPFVSLWVGNQQYAGNTIAGLAALNYALLPIFSFWGWVFAGLGRIDLLLPYATVQASLSLGLSLLATWMWGLSGPLIATAVVNLAYNPWWMTRLLKVEFGVEPCTLLASALLPFVPALAILSALFGGYLLWPHVSWLRFACELAGAVGAYGAIAWGLVLGPGNRDAIRQLVRKFAYGSA